AVDIASDLIHCAPDLAIELVEKSTNNQEDDNALDWAYAKLSISAFQGNKRQRPTETLENLNLKIRDPEARRFSTDVTILVGDFTGNELLSEVEKLDNPSDKIYMLRKWAVENRDSKDSAKVVQSALDLIVKTGTYAPNASVLRELATPLPYIQDITEAIPLVSSFDGLRSSAEHSGPTQDYVMLQILLAETEAKYDFDSAGNRAVDIYLYISELKDLSVKNACMAQLVASLEKIDPEQALEIKHGIRTLSTSDLEHDLKILLESTADHYQALKGAIRALAQTVPQKALFIAFELNTEDRRDMALYEIVESVLTLPVFEIDFVFLHDIIKRINDIDYQDDLIVNILTKIHANIEGLANFQATLGVLNEARNISNLGAKCRACSLVYKILCKINDPRHTSLAEGMLKELKDAWEAIDVGWHKVDIGFKIVGTLAEESPDLAQNYFTKTEQFRDELLFDSKSTSLSYLSSLRLAIRAYSGLLPKGIDTTGDIDRITRLINRIPSYGERAFIWSELAMKMYINKRLNQCIDIVNGHLKPALQQIPQRNKNYYQMVVKSVAPALYCAHRATSFDYIASLPLELKDSALYGICQFILRKTLASEPYEYQGVQGYNIVFEEIIDLIDLMGKMNYDGWIYNIISSIADSILKNRNNFTREQIADLGRRLEQLINKKFPDLRNIKHDGYKIISLAEVARITKARNHVWLQLIDHAKSVPNLADRAFVLTVVAVAWRTNNVDTEKRWSTIKEAKELVEQIPAKYDQIEHYEMLASLVSDIDAAMCKNLIQTAMSATYEHDDLDMSQVRRRLIDLAYRVDPDLASSLASISDDDEARSAMRKKAKKHVDFLELKKGMADRKRPKELKDKLHSPLDYSQAAWTLLGSLNAGRITPCHLKDTREYVEIAAGLPLSDSYPILSWIVENAKIRFANTNEAHQFLRPMFDASLMGAELCAIMAERSYANLKRTTDNAATHQEENSILIRPKDRDVGINYLRKWIRDEAKA
ncbi:MAG: hypothetical protein M0T74_14805, partial [Desulfitobacterium hafniense]|nr:hypothetical protein [Desulfitobacterium hafniense]